MSGRSATPLEAAGSAAWLRRGARRSRRRRRRPTWCRKLPEQSGALLFVDLEGARHVIPVLDSGEDTEHYVLVMARAETSLQAHLRQRGALPEAEVVDILRDIATALEDFDGRVVHRDLKPENVLYLNGEWCLADFGISRYAEASTAEDTRKFAMTPQYAAPEQWRWEHATSAADVYAFGVMAYELLATWRFRARWARPAPPRRTARAAGCIQSPRLARDSVPPQASGLPALRQQCAAPARLRRRATAAAGA